MGITNQRETCLIWDRKTGEHIHNAIVWHDTRTTKIVDQMIKEKKGNKDYYREKTGLPMATYFSAFKFKWMIENVLQIKEKIQGKNTIDTWMIFVKKIKKNNKHLVSSNFFFKKLTGNFFTDVTNASRMMLMNLLTLDWDDEILKDFGIPRQVLPQILASSDFFGRIMEGHLVPSFS